MPQEQEICCFWGGGELDYLEVLSLKSFVAAGHPVTMFAYDAPGEAPQGVAIRDAADIVPQDAAPAALMPDLVRWRCLAARPGVIWVEPDFALLAPLRPEGGRLLAEQGGGYLSPDIVALPPDSAALRAILAFMEEARPVPPWATAAERRALEALDSYGPEDLGTGVWGARALSHFAARSGETEDALPRSAFFPVSYADRALLLTKKVKLKSITNHTTAAIPLFRAELARELQEKHDGLPKYWTPLGRLLRQFEVSPREAPLFGKAPKAAGRWSLEEATPEADPAPEPVKPPEKPVPTPAPALAATASTDEPRVCILTTMKNEGPFILEWVAYHRSIGVKNFIVYTNDCDDGTVELLDLLAERGLITARIDNPFRQSKASDWQRAALWDAQSGDIAPNMDWVLPMDVDEFVNIHVGEGRFADMIAALPDPNMISFIWRLFGSGLQETFEDQSVTRSMTLAALETSRRPALAWGFKTAFKPAEHLTRWSVHRPMKIDEKDIDKLRWYAGSGAPMAADYHKNGWRANRNIAGYQLASLNHYAVRNCESYLVKRQRGRVNHIDEDQGIAYWFRMNHNVEEETSILNKLPRAEAELAGIMADPAIAAQHNACVAAHRERIEELKQRDDYASLLHEITSPKMRGYSRMTNHFGNWIFALGPKCIPHDYEEWASQMDENGVMPDDAGPPPGIQDSGTILPRPEFAEELNVRRKETNDLPNEIVLE